MRVLDLFSGLGGFALGLERVGFNIVAFCENEPFCRAVIRERWPNIQLYNDVRELDATVLAADGIECDVITGGFPCTDISIAGTGVGIAGAESGLWREFARLIGELRPRYVIVENVSALLVRGLDRVLADLATLGFDAEWHCLPATYVGAPHLRDRIWIVAYSNVPGLARQHRPVVSERGDARAVGSRGTSSPADSDSSSRWTHPNTLQQRLEGQHARGAAAWSVDRSRYERDTAGWWWESEPDVGRVAVRVPHRVERLRALGNAAVPQIIEVLGSAILAHARIGVGT